MNEPGAAMQYDQDLTHLVGQHGADADLLIGCALNLAQIRWAHFDTHAALEIAGIRPPDGHVHPTLPDPGGPGQPEVSFRPFLPSPSMARWALPLSASGRYPAWPVHTGLPQTKVCPPMNSLSDVTGYWALEAIASIVSRAQRETWRGLPAEVLAGYRDELKDLAGTAAARWQARSRGPAESARPFLSSASADRPHRYHGGLPPDPVDFPDKVRPEAPARGCDAGDHLPGMRTRRSAPSRRGRTS